MARLKVKPKAMPGSGAKKQGSITALFFVSKLKPRRLEGDDVLGLRAFLTLHDLELYPLAFGQVAVAFANDRVEMHEDISTGVALDETVSFRTVEPLDGALFFRHDSELLSTKIKLL
jgi:hypothetical protein